MKMVVGQVGRTRSLGEDCGVRVWSLVLPLRQLARLQPQLCVPPCAARLWSSPHHGQVVRYVGESLKHRANQAPVLRILLKDSIRLLASSARLKQKNPRCLHV